MHYRHSGLINDGCISSLFSETHVHILYMSSSVRLSVCLLSVTFVRTTQTIEIFANVFTPFGTLAICHLCVKILRRSSQGNAFVRGLNPRGVGKYSDFGPFEGYISETVLSYY